MAVFTDGGVRSVCDAAACAEDRCALPPEVSERHSPLPRRCADSLSRSSTRGEDGRLTPPKAVGLTGEANIPMRDNQPADAEIRLYELNGDGQLDMVVTNGSGHRDTFIGLSNENGALSFRRVRNNAGRSQPRLGDLNGDGRVDILWPERGALRVYWGQAAGFAQEQGFIAMATDMTGAVVADIDADGWSVSSTSSTDQPGDGRLSVSIYGSEDQFVGQEDQNDDNRLK